MSVHSTVLTCILVCVLTKESKAVLTLSQGRIVSSPAFSLEIFDIVGIATVELDGDPTSRPTYFFDCKTNLNNGSGITWTRMSTDNTFRVVNIDDGSAGKRLDATDIDYAELDVYTCSDQYSGKSVSLNITGFNPAIVAAEETVSVVQGLSVELEVYVSGYPLPTESGITWQRPDGTIIRNTDFGVSFQGEGRRLILSNVQQAQAGLYQCTVATSAGAEFTSILLDVNHANPSVFLQSRTQYVLPSISTTLEARVFATPSDSATVRWYHQGTLIDDVIDNRYTASSEGDIHRLRVSSVSEAETGEYTIVVSLNGVTANDTTMLAFLVSPSATVTPSSISVDEGEEVRLICEVTGSGPLTVSWTLSDGSPPPFGVQENGNELVISAANTSHPGTYVCSVSNLGGSSQDEAIVTVYYSPQVVITYSDMTSDPNELLYLVRNHGDQGPTVVCSATGNPPPSIRWTQERLPSGIVQSTLPSSGDVELRWQRRIEFTDSGSYICQASNSIAAHTATLDILVQNEPAIISIYPYNLEIMRDSQTFSYIVPLGYEGIALVCTADGWPAPEVEWQKDGQTLLNGSGPGVVSESDTFASTVSARLIWSREFNSLDMGNYECVVRKPNMLDTLDSRVVQVKIVPTMTVQALPVTCSIDQISVFFQIRVLGTDCTSWGGSLSSQIAADFRNEILSVVRTECGCQVDGSDLDVLGSPQCSSKVEGAAVFRGKIETTSQTRTELAYCALFSWQQKSPLIRINEQFRAVDSSCSLEASGSLDSEECVRPPTAPSSQLTTTLSIAGVTVALILALVIVFITIFCVWQKRSRKRRFSFDTTDVYSRVGQDPVALSGQLALPQDFIAQSVGPNIYEMVDTDTTYYDTIPLRSRDIPTPSQLDWSGTYHVTNAHTGSPSENTSPLEPQSHQLSHYEYVTDFQRLATTDHKDTSPTNRSTSILEREPRLETQQTGLEDSSFQHLRSEHISRPGETIPSLQIMELAQAQSVEISVHTEGGSEPTPPKDISLTVASPDRSLNNDEEDGIPVGDNVAYGMDGILLNDNVAYQVNHFDGISTSVNEAYIMVTSAHSADTSTLQEERTELNSTNDSSPTRVSLNRSLSNNDVYEEDSISDLDGADSAVLQHGMMVSDCLLMSSDEADKIAAISASAVDSVMRDDGECQPPNKPR